MLCHLSEFSHRPWFPGLLFCYGVRRGRPLSIASELVLVLKLDHGIFSRRILP